MAWSLPIQYFFALSYSSCMSTSVPSLSPYDSFFHVLYQFGLSVMFFLFWYFTPKLFYFLCIWSSGLSSCILCFYYYPLVNITHMHSTVLMLLTFLESSIIKENYFEYMLKMHRYIKRKVFSLTCCSLYHIYSSIIQYNLGLFVDFCSWKL